MMKVTLIGTSCGVPTKERGLPCVALQREGEMILFDCGEGTQRQMMRFGMSFMKISSIFITHFHGDHFLGLFGLLQSMSFFGREEQLTVFGPRGIVEICRTAASIGHFKPGFEIVAKELGDGDQVQFNGYRVTASRVDHIVPTLGYALEEDVRPGRFDLEKAKALGIPEGRLYKELQMGREIQLGGRTIRPEDVMGPPRPGRKFVYLGDVRPCPEAVELSTNADLLVTEATFCEDLAERAEETGHSTVKGACGIARRAGAKRLLLTHFSPRYSREDILAEVDFDPVFIGEDGMSLEIPYPDQR